MDTLTDIMETVIIYPNLDMAVNWLRLMETFMPSQGIVQKLLKRTQAPRFAMEYFQVVAMYQPA